jgi:hypothetical protein
MGNSPYEFIMSADETDLNRFSEFVHRTFNSSDCILFIRYLRHLYTTYTSLQDVIVSGMKSSRSLKEGISHFRSTFFSYPHSKRNEKHFAGVMSDAAGKRLNMLRRIIKVA